MATAPRVAIVSRAFADRFWPDRRAVGQRFWMGRIAPDAPLTREEIEAKFRGNAALALPAAQVERVIAGVDGLAENRPLKDLLEAL